MNDLSGRTAVLTGAGSDFGLECPRIAAARGMKLVLVDIRPQPLEATRAGGSGTDSLASIQLGLQFADELFRADYARRHVAEPAFFNSIHTSETLGRSASGRVIR